MTTTKRLKVHYLLSISASLIGLALVLAPGFTAGLFRTSGTSDYAIPDSQAAIGGAGLVLLGAGGVWLLVTRVRMWLQRTAS